MYIKMGDGSSISKRKKNRGKIAAVIIGVLLLLLVILTAIFDKYRVAYADSATSFDELENELSDSVSDAIDSLDLSELERFISSLGDEQRMAFGLGDIREALKAFVAGEGGDFFGRIMTLVANTAGKYFAGFLPGFITIIIICLLKNMLGGLTGDFLNGSTTEVVHIVCYCAIIVVLMSGVTGIIVTVKGTLDALARLADIIFPILLTLLSMLGGTVAVGGYSPFVAALSTLIIRLINSVIVPAFIAAIVFSVVGNISKSVKLDKLTGLVKSASGWLIGVVFGIFATFLTAQGVTGGIVDRFGFNIAKFALSSYVPILGGYLSDGVDLLSASLTLVKNALGYTAVGALACAVLFPIVRVIIFSLALRLTAAIAEPIGDSRVASLLSNVASTMNLLITALAGVAFLFFLLLMLLIGSCNFGV